MIACQICGKMLNRISNTHLRAHETTMKEYKEKYGETGSPEYKEAHAEQMRLQSENITPERREIHRQHLLRRRREEPGFVEKSCVAARRRMLSNNPSKDPECIARGRATNQERGRYLEASARMRSLWQDPAFREAESIRMKTKNPSFDKEVYLRSCKNHNRKISGPESAFLANLDDDVRMQVEYIGNNKLFIEGRNPDFKIKGVNKVIEITTSAYRRTEATYDQPRIQHFNKNGYECLVLWLRAKYPLYLQDAFRTALNDLLRRYITGTVASQTWREYYA